MIVDIAGHPRLALAQRAQAQDRHSLVVRTAGRNPCRWPQGSTPMRKITALAIAVVAGAFAAVPAAGAPSLAKSIKVPEAQVQQVHRRRYRHYRRHYPRYYGYRRYYAPRYYYAPAPYYYYPYYGYGYGYGYRRPGFYFYYGY
jgi:hypothetical protein